MQQRATQEHAGGQRTHKAQQSFVNLGERPCP